MNTATNHVDVLIIGAGLSGIGGACWYISLPRNNKILNMTIMPTAKITHSLLMLKVS